ncbi:hypothetical protein ACQEU6_08715 [Spirillospora sp. CA-108201]
MINPVIEYPYPPSHPFAGTARYRCPAGCAWQHDQRPSNESPAGVRRPPGPPSGDRAQTLALQRVDDPPHRVTAAFWDHCGQAHPAIVRARIDDEGVVELAGVVDDAISKIGSVVHVLTVGMRPCFRMQAGPTVQLTQVVAHPDGRVTLAAAHRQRVELDGIRFPLQLP